MVSCLSFFSTDNRKTENHSIIKLQHKQLEIRTCTENEQLTYFIVTFDWRQEKKAFQCKINTPSDTCD